MADYYYDYYGYGDYGYGDYTEDYYGYEDYAEYDYADYYYEDAAPAEMEEESSGSMAGMAYLLVPVLDLATWGYLQFSLKDTNWETVQWVALAGGAVKLLGCLAHMMMGMNLYIPVIGIAHSIALIVFTYMANSDLEDSTGMILGYSAGGLGVLLGAWAAMDSMGGDDAEVEGEYYEDYYYYDDDYYYADDYYGDEYADDYYGYGDDYYGYDYYYY